jgi:hypothetical protein
MKTLDSLDLVILSKRMGTVTEGTDHPKETMCPFAEITWVGFLHGVIICSFARD